MAKRTSRSEADDTPTAAPPRPAGAPTNAGRTDADGRGRSRTPRTGAPGQAGQAGQAGQERQEGAPDAADTFAARSEGDQPQSSVSTSEPTEEEIRYRAYELYLERGGEHGMDFEDWVRAERELKERQ